MHKYEVEVFPEYRWLSSDGHSNVLFDVSSSNLLQVDDLTLQVIKKWKANQSKEQVARDFLEEYGVDIEPVFPIIDALENRGSLRPISLRREIKLSEGFDAFRLTLNLSEDCQLHCRYCFGLGGDYGRPTTDGVMSKETAAAAVDFLLRNHRDQKRKVDILFFGGEPLLNREVIVNTIEHTERARKGSDKIVTYSLSTNGVDLDKEFLSFLLKYNTFIMMSIDGMEELHNRLRPSATGSVNSWKEAYKTLKSILENRGLVGLRTTLTSDRLDIYDFVENMYNDGVRKFYFSFVSCDHDDPLHVSVDDATYYIEALDACKRKWQDIFVSLPHVIYYRLMGRQLNGFFCEAGRSGITVSTDGTVYPCHRYNGRANYVCGNVNTEVDVAKLLKFSQETHVSNMPLCSSCWMRFLCSGTCIEMRTSENGVEYLPSSLACFYTKQFIRNEIEAILKGN